MLKARRVLETAVYCDDMARTAEFYKALLALEPMRIDRLSTLHIPVESRVDWPRGGHSIYFRDPDGRSVELATPGIWPCY